ncbi:hypothetical protein C1645_828332 [Glomus cerebriforme]|uniref:Galactose oxidase n=1 Tax=Glomus cerebriforme TaxID=658196 RepID=A0A397SMY1_9GLOM|nr:hypothetical protein C1645_828332 [Glomus cerebriforme]
MSLSSKLIYVIFVILLQLFIEVNSQKAIEPFFFGDYHTATFISNKLYILGNDAISGNELFLYLDVSISFDTHELNWNDLSKNNIVPPHIGSVSVGGGTNNNTLFLYGGSSLNNGTVARVYTFDTQNNSWSIPQIIGIPPAGTLFITPTIWKQVSSINAPSPRIFCSSVLLPNKNIIYIGGTNLSAQFSLNEVYLYDTINDIWTTQITYGSIPSARDSHTSILGLDGQRVIIFGGIDNLSQSLSPENSLYVLDINNFNWYIPKVSGKIPSSRDGHKALLIDKYMVVTFGTGYTQANVSDILLLDISNNNEYVWTTFFDLNNKSDTTSSNNTTSHSNPKPLDSKSLPLSVIIGIVVGFIIVLSALTICLFKMKKLKMRGRTKNIPHVIEELIN